MLHGNWRCERSSIHVEVFMFHGNWRCERASIHVEVFMLHGNWRCERTSIHVEVFMLCIPWRKQALWTRKYSCRSFYALRIWRCERARLCMVVCNLHLSGRMPSYLASRMQSSSLESLGKTDSTVLAVSLISSRRMFVLVAHSFTPQFGSILRFPIRAITCVRVLMSV